MYHVDNEESEDNVIWLISWAFLFFDKTFEFPHPARAMYCGSQLAKCIKIQQFLQLQSQITQV